MSYTNEDIFCAVRDGDLEKVRRMVKDGVELSQVPEREVIRSSRGYVFEIDPAESVNCMSITIDDVYAGTSWEDTCITEILLYAES